MSARLYVPVYSVREDVGDVCLKLTTAKEFGEKLDTVHQRLCRKKSTKQPDKETPASSSVRYIG